LAEAVHVYGFAAALVDVVWGFLEIKVEVMVVNKIKAIEIRATSVAASPD